MTMLKRGKDISTMFTKEENKKNGRLGYYNATREKDTIWDVFTEKREKISKSVLTIDTPKKDAFPAILARKKLIT